MPNLPLRAGKAENGRAYLVWSEGALYPLMRQMQITARLVGDGRDDPGSAPPRGHSEILRIPLESLP